MPRPRRSRRAPAHAADAAPAESEVAPERGRSNAVEHHSDQEQEAPRRSTRRGRKPSVDTAPLPVGAVEETALQKSSNARDKAMERLALEDVLTTSDATGSEANKLDLSVELGRRVQATPAQQRRDTTGLDLDDEVFDALDDSLDDESLQQAPASGQRSTDVSSMTTSVFKRRGRAPSVSLHGNDSGAIRPSSRAGTTPAISSSFNIGAFRRRQREPSILGTTRKPRADSPVQISSGAASSDEEDEFAPEAESTPLNRRKTRTAPDAEPAGEGSSSTRSRKRKSMEAHEGSDRPEKVSRLESEAGAEVEPDVEVEAEVEPEIEAEVEPRVEVEVEPEVDVEVAEEMADERPDVVARDSDSDSDLSSLPSLPSPQLPPFRATARPSTPINQTDLMAPPESSGSEMEDIWPDLRAAARRKPHGPVTPLRDGDVSDVSTPPSLTHSPNLPATRQRAQKKQKNNASPKMTTASLTGLLPRRRQRKDAPDASSDTEIDASGLAHDDDELSYLDARPRRKGRTTPLARRNAANRGRTTPKSKTTPVAARTVKRTYGRRSSDKENGSDGEGETGLSPAPDDTFDGGDDTESVAEELKNAVKKFQEVDQWEMEFEEMTQSSSPSGAR